MEARLKSLDPTNVDFYHLPVVSGRLSSAHIEIGTGQNQLTVEGGKKEKQEREYLYRGISTRAIIAVAAGAAWAFWTGLRWKPRH